MGISVSTVDGVLDSEEGDPSKALADLLDRRGGWDWSEGAERLGILESSGSWWLVYRGSESDSSARYGDYNEAWLDMAERADLIKANAPRTEVAS